MATARPALRSRTRSLGERQYSRARDAGVLFQKYGCRFSRVPLVAFLDICWMLVKGNTYTDIHVRCSFEPSGSIKLCSAQCCPEKVLELLGGGVFDFISFTCIDSEKEIGGCPPKGAKEQLQMGWGRSCGLRQNVSSSALL